MNGVTLHTDKYGVVREYVEERRMACVGELVMYKWTSEIGTVVEIFGGDTLYKLESGAVWSIDNTIVLVPTGVIQRDGKRWREVEREAKVGESIVIVAPKATCGDYDTGDMFVVSSADRAGVAVVQPDHSKLDFMFHSEYRVLEPIDDTAPSPTPPDVDRIAALEQRVTELERGLRMREIANGVADRNDGALSKLKDTYTREQVVDMAKHDVEELLSSCHENVPCLFGGMCGYYPTTNSTNAIDFVDFRVDRNKRTVVALIRMRDVGKTPPGVSKVWARGIAKCEALDCFNVWIGKALSLRRALGLDVPDYYINAPKPTVAQVGDMVTWGYGTTLYCVTRPWDGRSMDFYSMQSGFPFDNYDAKYVAIVDDSHDYAGQNR